MFARAVSFLLALQLLCTIDVASARLKPKPHWQAKQAAALQNFASKAPPSSRPGPVRANNITFSNPKAAEFLVDGTKIPEVDFDVGPSWAGLLPISGAKNETRKLFFWFFPPASQGSADDLVLWTNGGPGCSSLEGALQEIGAKPTVNEFSWTNLSSVLFVEQPVGTGFSQGKPNIKDEDDLAAQLVGFLQQFLDVFSELKERNFYLTGESYAGMYVPYIANYIYSNPTALALNLKGTWISDPVLAGNVIQSEMPAVNFVHQYQNVFGFNSSFLAKLDSRAAACHYDTYSATHVTYPPKGLLPLPGQSPDLDPGCDLWDDILSAALLINPAFDIYRIFDTYPILWDVLGFPGTFEQIQVAPVYFNRQDVKQALHAPLNVQWSECSDVNVFPHGDASPPSYTILPNVIEKNERTVIVHGLADFILIAEGTRAVIQNITWNGQQGFQTPIQEESFVVDGMGALGNLHSERGLTYYEVALSGHMVPQFSPKAAFHIMQYLLGFRTSP